MKNMVLLIKNNDLLRISRNFQNVKFYYNCIHIILYQIDSNLI